MYDKTLIILWISLVGTNSRIHYDDDDYYYYYYYYDEFLDGLEIETGLKDI